MTEIASLVLYAEDPDRTAAFYRALGVPLAAESHDRGLSHLAADVAGVHVAVYPADRPGQAPGRRDGGSTFPGFYVDSLDGAVAALAELGARLLGEHEQMPWGCRVIATDPDGRAVEGQRPSALRRVRVSFDATAVIAAHSAGFAAVASDRLAAPVEHCPGWTVADLTRHLLDVQWFWATIVDERLASPPAEDRRPSPPPEDELLGRFVAGGDRLVAVLRAVDPATPLWTWAPAQHDAGFVIRHQVQEAAVHHWDAAHAAGAGLDLAAEVAADAVEEFLTFSVSSDLDPAEPARPALDGRFVLRCTDLDRAWVVDDGAAPGTIQHAPGAEPGLPVVSATASDLWLWLYGRVAVDRGVVPAALLERFRGLTFTG